MLKTFYPGFISGRGAFGLLVVRAVVGAAFIFHGWGKVQNPMGWMNRPNSPPSEVPGVLQAAAAFSEFGGGIALVLGLLTPLAALLIACTMAVAMGHVHIPKGDPFVSASGGPSYELAAVYFAVMIMLLCVGPGSWSVDAMLFGGSDRRYGRVGPT